MLPDVESKAFRSGCATGKASVTSLTVIVYSASGSSRRIKRVMVMTEPPSIDSGEITDKGYVNQRLVQSRRANLVDALFSDPPGLGVLTL